MKLVVLGSGTSVPHPRRASAAFWLETENGTMLLDVSADAAHRAAQEKLDWAELDAIWVSHFHLDHMGGLAPFLFGLKWAPQTQSRRKPLIVFGPEGLKRILEAVDHSNNYGFLNQPFPLELFEVKPNAGFVPLPGLSARTFSTPHTDESMAIRLTEENGTSIVYSSDTGFSDHLVEFSRDADVLLLECSFRANKPVEKHLQLSDAMTIAKTARPGKLVLTHLYPEWDGIDVAAEAKALWSGQTIEAHDGLCLEF
ncbi:MAG TPA: MBL fold metallo-hydrolase [Pyrinomonadaceae bacterium]